MNVSVVSVIAFLRKFFFSFSLVFGAILFFALIGSKLVSRILTLLGKQGEQGSPYGWKWMLKFMRQGRPVPQLLDRMYLRSGEQLLELGAGTGLFTTQAARRVGSKGSLHAVDIQAEMIEEIQHKIKASGLRNVQTHVASASALPIRAMSIDKTLLIDVLPEIADPQQALSEIARVLKPNGILYISEEFSEPNYQFMKETISQVERSGLFVLSTQQGNWWCYTLGFRKRQPAAQQMLTAVASHSLEP